METNSDNWVLKTLSKINTILTFYRHANLKQYFINTTQVLTLVLRCKIMQHNNGGTVQYWQQIQFQILVNLLKWYIQIFLGEDGGRSSHHSDLKNQTMMKILAIRMANHPLYLNLPLILSVYHYYFHSLLPTLINAPPPKHFQLKVTHLVCQFACNTRVIVDVSSNPPVSKNVKLL